MRRGNWMQTFTGRQFWPMDPNPLEVCIEDIAHSLSLQCRFAGHCRSFYSVAQHSVLVSQEVEERNIESAALWGLLHDASEAYLVDVPRPVKPHLGGYAEAEALVMLAVTYRFGLSPVMPAEVKRADGVLLATEARDLMARPPVPWAPMPPPRAKFIDPWAPDKAERIFLQRFADLTGARHG